MISAGTVADALIGTTWDWTGEGACLDGDAERFFHPEGERGHARALREDVAKQVCLGCPVRPRCAAHALASGEPYGVWGGFSESDRQHLRRVGWVDAANTDRTWADIDVLETRLQDWAT